MCYDCFLCLCLMFIFLNRNCDNVCMSINTLKINNAIKTPCEQIMA